MELKHTKLAPLPDKPLVSIIMPSFNQGRFIRMAIESILKQSYRPLELLVIDGASTDETVDVLKSFGTIPELSWWSEPDKGPVDAVNKGFSRAKGQVIGIQSSDDGYLPGAIEDAVQALKDSGAEIPGLVYGDVQKIDANDRCILSGDIPRGDLGDFLAKKTWVAQPAAFIRGEILAAIGGWDETIPYTPDTDLWMRIWFRYPVKKVDRKWGLLRFHSDQRDCAEAKICRDWKKMIRQSREVQQSSLKLRRAAWSGIHRNSMVYSGGSDLVETYHLWISYLLWPPSYAEFRGEWRRLLPGFLPLMRRLSWIKQNVLGMSGRQYRTQ